MDPGPANTMPTAKTAAVSGPVSFGQTVCAEPGPGATDSSQARCLEQRTAAAGRAVGAWAGLLRAASDAHFLALADQALASGTNFLTTILLGRLCGPGELGAYSLGFTLLVVWVCAQESLIALPYTVYRHRPPADKSAAYAGSVLVYQGLLSAVAVATLAATGMALTIFGGAVPGLARVVWVLAGVVPLLLLREFGRHFAFAHLRMGQAVVLDLAVAGVQLAGLAWLAWTGGLSASSAYAVVGAACALASALWLYRARGSFVFRGVPLWRTVRQSWSLGKWLLASQVTVAVQGYFIHWLLAGLLGTAATGVYAACLAVVQLANPLILGVGSVLMPRAVQSFAACGAVGLRRVVVRTTLLLGSVMALFSLVLLLAGEDILDLLYRRPQYEGHGHPVAVLALAMLAGALGMPAAQGLAAVEGPRVIFRVGLITAGLSVLLTPCLVMGWGVPGAAYGFLAGNVVGSAGRWIAFAALVLRRHSPVRPEPVAEGAS